MRKQCYRSVFAGACGVTYGHHSIWQFAGSLHGLINFAERSWQEAIDRPGAQQIHHLKDLILSRPYWKRIPDHGILLSTLGKGSRYVSTTRDSDERFSFIYIQEGGQTIEIDLTKFKFPIQASWFDPREGIYTPIKRTLSLPSAVFKSPQTGPDWVLVLDAISSHLTG